MWIAACDDDARFRLWLEQVLRPILPPGDALTSHPSGSDLLDTARKANKPIDLLLLDMEMQGMDGLASARELLSFSPGTIIVVLTSYAGYALPCYDIRAFQYLLKPVAADRLRAVLEEVRRIRTRAGTDALTILTRGESLFVPVEDVLYVESRSRALYLHTFSGEIRYPEPIKKAADRLAEKGIVRIHKSFLVNMAYVRRIDKRERQVILTPGESLPIGNRRIETLLGQITEYRKKRYG